MFSVTLLVINVLFGSPFPILVPPPPPVRDMAGLGGEGRDITSLDDMAGVGGEDQGITSN